jgi:hypothetical protein
LCPPILSNCRAEVSPLTAQHQIDRPALPQSTAPHRHSRASNKRRADRVKAISKRGGLRRALEPDDEEFRLSIAASDSAFRW